MSSPKPTFVLVPGAFHTGTCYSLLVPHLEKAGYSTHSVTLPSIDNGEITLSDDIEYLRESILLPLFDSETPDVVLVVHSYGGYPGSGAMKGLSKKEREMDGQKGGIVGVIYVTAMVPKVGMRPVDGIGGSLRPWHHLEHTDQSPDRSKKSTGLVTASETTQYFYNDVSAALLPQLESELRGHSLKTWEEPLTAVGYADPPYQGRVAYVRTTKDNAILPEAQDKMMAESGVEWIVREIETGHSPFVVEPEVLAGFLVEVAEGWASV